MYFHNLHQCIFAINIVAFLFYYWQSFTHTIVLFYFSANFPIVHNNHRQFDSQKIYDFFNINIQILSVVFHFSVFSYWFLWYKKVIWSVLCTWTKMLNDANYNIESDREYISVFSQFIPVYFLNLHQCIFTIYISVFSQFTSVYFHNLHQCIFTFF